MIKDILIGSMAAALMVENIPWFAACTMQEKTGIFMGICGTLIIFCFFCDEMAEKWRKYRARVLEIEKRVERLRNAERKITGNPGQAGTGPGRAPASHQ